MTRRELAAALASLPEDEKLELIGELWDSLEHSGPLPEWHKDELDRRLATTEGETRSSWTEAKARILGSK